MRPTLRRSSATRNARRRCRAFDSCLRTVRSTRAGGDARRIRHEEEAPDRGLEARAVLAFERVAALHRAPAGAQRTARRVLEALARGEVGELPHHALAADRKSTRLNSSHSSIS